MHWSIEILPNVLKPESNNTYKVWWLNSFRPAQTKIIRSQSWKHCSWILSSLSWKCPLRLADARLRMYAWSKHYDSILFSRWFFCIVIQKERTSSKSKRAAQLQTLNRWPTDRLRQHYHPHVGSPSVAVTITSCWHHQWSTRTVSRVPFKPVSRQLLEAANEWLITIIIMIKNFCAFSRFFFKLQ